VSIPSSSQHQPSSARVQGAAAERRACWYLRLRGWRICARNWIGGGGELDIVASRWRTLLIVEVRSRIDPVAALASVDRAKLDRTLASSAALVRMHGLERYRLRLDVMGFDASGRLAWSADVLRRGLSGS
jgi:putative endonuclease